MSKDVSRLYASVFSAPPWNEDWTLESALRELDEVRTKAGFSGVIARSGDGILLGFLWGYLVPPENTARVDFEKIRRELTQRQIAPNETYYWAEAGVRTDSRKRGIATLLLERTIAKGDYKLLCVRTKNPTIVDMFRRACGGPEDFSFPEESSYPGGMIYVRRVRP
ncbi:MAG TPA: hypothetical protein VJH22_00730 [Candidatus Nanoarchaeia archaeon]|nr:hypothetical protein [Candidatus Nanoarchaeia archaeon]